MRHFCSWNSDIRIFSVSRLFIFILWIFFSILSSPRSGLFWTSRRFRIFGYSWNFHLQDSGFFNLGISTPKIRYFWGFLEINYYITIFRHFQIICKLKMWARLIGCFWNVWVISKRSSVIIWALEGDGVLWCPKIHQK